MSHVPLALFYFSSDHLPPDDMCSNMSPPLEHKLYKIRDLACFTLWGETVPGQCLPHSPARSTLLVQVNE